MQTNRIHIVPLQFDWNILFDHKHSIAYRLRDRLLLGPDADADFYIHVMLLTE